MITIGQGEISGVFNRGFLKQGYPVYPVLRGDPLASMAQQLPEPELVLIAVGEGDIHNVIADIPPSWCDRTVLIQNELLPRDWERSTLNNPTVISVWFEKKAGQDYKVIVPSPIFGPQAELLKKTLATLNIPSWVVTNEEELLFELVGKNLYILTTNITGLILPEGATVGELLHQPELLDAVSSEILEIQYALIGKRLDKQALIDSIRAAFDGDLAHKCMGRSAPSRLERTLAIAQQENIITPMLQKISHTLSNN